MATICYEMLNTFTIYVDTNNMNQNIENCYNESNKFSFQKLATIFTESRKCLSIT